MAGWAWSLEATAGAEFEARSQLMYWKQPVLIQGVQAQALKCPWWRNGLARALVSRSDQVAAPAPDLDLERRQELRAPGSGSTPTTTANGSAGPHTGDTHPFRRYGQPPTVASDAPAASTPPGRREPGR